MIHVDIDGTLLDSLGSWRRDRKIQGSITDYDLDVILYPGATVDYIQWIQDGNKARMYKGAIRALHKLRERTDVLITTARYPTGIDVFKKQYPVFADIVVPKWKVIKDRMECDVLIDDYPNPDHVYLAGKTYIVHRPYNVGVMPEIERVESFEKIARKLP